MSCSFEETQSDASTYIYSGVPIQVVSRVVADISIQQNYYKYSVALYPCAPLQRRHLTSPLPLPRLDSCQQAVLTSP